MSLVITGATGKLGGRTVDALLRRGVHPSEVVATGRNPERLAELAARGVRTARLDIDDPATVAAAFDGAQQVLIVSMPGNPRRVEQHRTAIEAAQAAGVALVAYTSFVLAGKDDDHADHEATERVLHESGVPHVTLRNGVYWSYFVRQIPGWRRERSVVGAAGDGRVSAAAHQDLADAIATVLTTAGHEGAVYELGMDDAFTLSELAAEIGRQTGEAMTYVDLVPEEFEGHLVASGMAPGVAGRRANVDRGIAAGLYAVDTGDLRRLVGRPLMTMPEAVALALS